MTRMTSSAAGASARRVVLAASVCALALAAAACSRSSDVAQFPAERQFLGGDPLGAIGLRPRRQARIDYDPRSPLVMPPAPNLQTPEERSEIAANWPNDPDVARRDQEEAREEYLRERAEQEDRTQVLSPDELDSWAREAGMRTSAESDTTAGRRTANILSPAQLRGRRAAPPDPNVEPERRRLTQPPEGYRRAVPDANGQVQLPQEEEPRRGLLSGLFRR